MALNKLSYMCSPIQLNESQRNLWGCLAGFNFLRLEFVLGVSIALLPAKNIATEGLDKDCMKTYTSSYYCVWSHEIDVLLYLYVTDNMFLLVFY